MAKAGVKFCYACGCQLTGLLLFGDLPVCSKCWNDMTPAERATRQEARNADRRLLELLLAVENNAYLAKQTARLAKVLEALIREIREPCQNFQDLINRIHQRIDEAAKEKEEDDDSWWKEGRAPNE